MGALGMVDVSGAIERYPVCAGVFKVEGRTGGIEWM
jgi:hypothetical protein